MRVLITSNSHRHYDRTGTITRKIGPIGGRTYWTVRLDSGGVTTVSDGQFREVKRQDR
jgi:hypothetical protein